MDAATLILAKKYADKLIKDADFRHYTPIVGEVKTVDYDSSAKVSITWDDEKKIETFNFAIPRGGSQSSEPANIEYEDTQTLLNYYKSLKE